MKLKQAVTILVFAALMVMPAVSFATDRAWDAGTADWATAGNWDPDGTPTSSDDLDVGNGGTATISSGSQQALSLTIYNGSTVSVTGGSLTTDTLIISTDSGGAGVFTQSGGSTVTVNDTISLGADDRDTTYTLSSGILNAGNFSTPDAGTGDTTLTMGANTVLNVSGNLDFNAGPGGLSGDFHLYMDDTAQINLIGDGSYEGEAGGCEAFNASIKNLSAANGGQTDLASHLFTQNLELGAGTLNGTIGYGSSYSVVVMGSGTPLEFTGVTETVFTGLPTFAYAPTSGDLVTVAAGSYNGIDQLILGNHIYPFSDTNFALAGNIGTSAASAPQYLFVGVNDPTGTYDATLSIGGHDITTKNGIAIGYIGSLDGEDVDLHAHATATNGAVLSGEDGLLIDVGSSLTLQGSTTISSPTGALFIKGALDVDGTLNADVGTVIIGPGGVLQGSGTITGAAITIEDGAILSPGNSPGTLTIDGETLTWGEGGILNWDFADINETPGVGWDLVSFINGASLAITASESDPFQIHIYGYAAGFDEDVSYLNNAWRMTNGAGLLSLDTDLFAVTAHDVGWQGFFISLSGGDIYMNYASPEPSTMVAIFFGAGLVAWRRFRKRLLKPKRSITHSEGVSVMSRRIGIGIVILMVLAGAMALMAPPLCAEEINLPDPYTVDANNSGTIVSGDIVNGGAITISGGGSATVEGTVNATTITLGTETTGGSLTIATGGIVNVTNIYDTDKTVDGNRNALNMNGGTLNVGGNLEVGGTGASGCLGGLSSATEVNASSGTVNLTGTGNLQGSGGCLGDVGNPFSNVTAAADGKTTTLTGSTAMNHLETYGGTLTGVENASLVFTGSGNVWARDPSTSVNVDSITFLPLDGGNVNIPSGDYSQIEKISFASWFGDTADTVYTLGGDLLAPGADIQMGKQVTGTTLEAVLATAGYDVSVKNFIVGYNEQTPDGQWQNPTVYASLNVGAGSSVTASDSLIVHKGGTLILDQGTTVTADQVSLLGDLDNSGAITGVSQVIIDQTGSFVNNGTIAAGEGGNIIIIARDGGVLGGNATYADTTIRIESGGYFNIGNSPGVVTLDDPQDILQLQGGGGAELELWKPNEASPGTTPPTNWDYWIVTNGATIDITASALNPFALDIYGWNGTAQGEPVDFYRNQDYSWLILDTDSVSQFTNGFSADWFDINTYISNTVAGQFYLSQDGVTGDVYLNYNGVPEPATMVGLAAMLLGAGVRRVWRKRRA